MGIKKRKLKRNQKRNDFIHKHMDTASISKYEHMLEKRQKNEDSFRINMIGHLSALNDGIVAIFITVMMLSIPFPTSEAEYRTFLWSILVFMVSFFTLADFWYESKRTFEVAREADHAFVVANFVFLAVLALLPVTTNWIMHAPHRWAAVNFGVVYFLAAAMGEVLYYTAVRKRFEKYFKLFMALIIGRTAPVLIINAVLIVLAYFLPKWAILFYIVLPVVNFFIPKDNA